MRLGFFPARVVGGELFVMLGGGGGMLAMNLNEGGLASAPDAIGKDEAKNESGSQAKEEIECNPGSVVEDCAGGGKRIRSKSHGYAIRGDDFCWLELSRTPSKNRR